ncbi:hypothetical protein FQZ97_432780 [compost metagenome]
MHHRQGAQQAHRHHDRGDQRVAHVLQEQEHHQEHQHHRLDQGVDHLLDGHLDEARGVIGDGIFHALGEAHRQLGQALLDRFGGLDGVGAGG